MGPAAGLLIAGIAILGLVMAGAGIASSASAAQAAVAGGGSSSSAPATVTKGAYVNPLRHASSIGRTDQGVDATVPAGAPILAPGRIKIIGIIPNWFNGQPYVWWQLLDGPDAGKYQFVAEQITGLAQPGTILNAGETIAVGAASGTGIEFGWATSTGSTLARATTGYVEGQVTPAGSAIRQWLGSLGAAV